jgi:hypothetical protein
VAEVCFLLSEWYWELSPQNKFWNRARRDIHTNRYTNHNLEPKEVGKSKGI